VHTADISALEETVNLFYKTPHGLPMKIKFPLHSAGWPEAFTTVVWQLLVLMTHHKRPTLMLMLSQVQRPTQHSVLQVSWCQST